MVWRLANLPPLESTRNQIGWEPLAGNAGMTRGIGLILVVILTGQTTAAAAELSPARPVPAAVPRDVLEAETAGLIELKYIPNDSRSAQVVVKNNSDQPLTLQLPEAFAGVPVLAQMGMGGMGGMGGMSGMSGMDGMSGQGSQWWQFWR